MSMCDCAIGHTILDAMAENTDDWIRVIHAILDDSLASGSEDFEDPTFRPVIQFQSEKTMQSILRKVLETEDGDTERIQNALSHPVLEVFLEKMRLEARASKWIWTVGLLALLMLTSMAHVISIFHLRTDKQMETFSCSNGQHVECISGLTTFFALTFLLLKEGLFLTALRSQYLRVIVPIKLYVFFAVGVQLFLSHQPDLIRRLSPIGYPAMVYWMADSMADNDLTTAVVFVNILRKRLVTVLTFVLLISISYGLALHIVDMNNRDHDPFDLANNLTIASLAVILGDHDLIRQVHSQADRKNGLELPMIRLCLNFLTMFGSLIVGSFLAGLIMNDVISMKDKHTLRRIRTYQRAKSLTQWNAVKSTLEAFCSNMNKKKQKKIEFNSELVDDKRGSHIDLKTMMVSPPGERVPLCLHNFPCHCPSYRVEDEVLRHQLIKILRNNYDSLSRRQCKDIHTVEGQLTVDPFDIEKGIKIFNKVFLSNKLDP